MEVSVVESTTCDGKRRRIGAGSYLYICSRELEITVFAYSSWSWSSKISQQKFWHMFAEIYSSLKLMRPAAYTGHTRQISDEDLRIFAQSTILAPKRTNRFRGSQNITQRITEYLADCDLDIKGMVEISFENCTDLDLINYIPATHRFSGQHELL